MLGPEGEGKVVFNGQRPLCEQEPGMFEEPEDKPCARSMMCVREI